MEHVDHLHLLVHPGYGSQYENRISKEERTLFDRYHEIVDGMGDRDLLVALLMEAPNEKGNRQQRFVAQRITEMKHKLEKRMILVSSGLHVITNPPRMVEDLGRVGSVAHARRLAIDSKTECFLAGESFRHCVPASGMMANDVFRFSSPPVIRAHFTNLGVRKGETREMEQARFDEIEEQPHFPTVLVDWSVPEA